LRFHHHPHEQKQTVTAFPRRLGRLANRLSARVSSADFTRRVEPPKAPALTGQYQKNSRLAGVERISLGTGDAHPGAGFGPEDVAIDAEGRIYAGLDDGRIMRLQADGTRPEGFSNTHGRRWD